MVPLQYPVGFKQLKEDEDYICWLSNKVQTARALPAFARTFTVNPRKLKLSPIFYLAGMRILMSQLSGFYFR